MSRASKKRRLRLTKMKRDVSRIKPNGFEQYLTISELSRAVNKDVSWIRRLESEDRIPKASRVKMGRLQVRLWSPDQVVEIEAILSQMRPGRPASS